MGATIENKTNLNFFQKVWLFFKRNPIIILMAVVSLIVGIFVENFFSWSNLNNLISNTSLRFLIALGVSGCLIAQGTDLSAGRQVGLSACITGILIQRMSYSDRILGEFPEINMWLVLLIVLVLGALMGALNGWIIAYLRVPSFIATLGTQTIFYGIALVITDAQPIGGFQDAYTKFVNGTFFEIEKWDFPGLPYLLPLVVIAALIFWFIFNKTAHGKYIYAIGGNEIAAEDCGVRTQRVKFYIYSGAGILYALAGYLLAGKAGGANSNMGNGYELEAIAGCTIGGVSTTGGVGTVGGILVGVLVFELLKIVLQFLGVNPYYNYIIQGLVIIVAVALDIRKHIAKK